MITWSQEIWYHEAGFTYRTRATKRWMAQDAKVKADMNGLNDQYLSNKTGHFSSLKAYIRYQLAHRDDLLLFYGAK